MAPAVTARARCVSESNRQREREARPPGDRRVLVAGCGAVGSVFACFLRAAGHDVTTEVYPYTAAATVIESAIFNPGWQENFKIGYGDVAWALTGERLTKESFDRYRKQGGWVIIYMMKEEDVSRAVAHPGVMIASDGVPFVNGTGHPRGAGTFARTLGHYSRERKVLPLMDALAAHLRDVKFDLKAYTRTLLNSRVYQLTAEANDSNRDDRVADANESWRQWTQFAEMPEHQHINQDGECLHRELCHREIWRTKPQVDHGDAVADNTE